MSEENLHKFPINTSTSCQFKWTWSTLFLSVGTSSSCHRCKGWDVSKSMNDFHNHPGKIEDRKKMLNGEWPGNGCEYCKKVEDVGGISERQSYVNESLLSPKELSLNPTETSVTPRILEVYFTNVCNQKCVYCSPFFSSLLQREVEKFGPIEVGYSYDGFKPRNDYNELKVEFWKWMDKNSTDLFHFQILGGEPMYQEEFEECLTFFEERNHPDLNWKIFSNLKHDTTKFIEKINRISELVKNKKIKSFEIVCSMDCWGPEAEFSRYGMSLVEWERNFNVLLESEYVNISVHSTITPITLPTMWEFYEKINDWNKIKKVDFGWNTVKEPIFMNPEIIGVHAKEYLDKLLSVVPDNDGRKIYLEGIRNQIINHEVDHVRLDRLCTYLDKIDQRRGTNWKELYPWLNKIQINEN